MVFQDGCISPVLIRIVSLSLLGAVLIGLGCYASNPTEITAKDAKGLIDFNTPLIIIDVREPHEFCAVSGHLSGARNYPWNSGVLEKRYRELPPQAPIIVVCRSGRRSRRAVAFLRARGYRSVLSMARGMQAWQWETESCLDPNTTASD